MSYIAPAGAPPPRGPVNPGDWRYAPAPGQVPWRAPPPPVVPRPSSPLTFEHVKVSIPELPKVLGEIEGQLAKRRRNHILLFLFLAAGVAAAWMLVPLGVIATVVWLIFFFRGRKKIARKRVKLDFLRGLLDELRDELHPRLPVRFDFDLTAYDHTGKLERTARSFAGNTKSYYSDKWLRLRVVLADRTRVEIVRQVGVKQKKGNVVHEKRRLFVTVTPNPRRYRPMMGDPMANKLRWQIETAITQGFHNRPEQVAVHVTHHTEDIALRVAQWDAEILPGEVTLILGAVVTHLWERCLVTAAPSPRALGR